MHVLSLFDKSGIMVRPWLEAGHDAMIVDNRHTPHGTWLRDPALWFGVDSGPLKDFSGAFRVVGADLRIWRPLGFQFDLVFTFPPCTHLTASGALHWKEKGPGALEEALSLVNVAREILETSGAPGFVENPKGRLSTCKGGFGRKADVMFHPNEFGGYLPETHPDRDGYQKETCLWLFNGFELPERRVVPFSEDPKVRHKIHRMAPSPDRSDKRSLTPEGFARAVFNHYGGHDGKDKG